MTKQTHPQQAETKAKSHLDPELPSAQNHTNTSAARTGEIDDGISEAAQVLIQHQAVLVHCAGYVQMVHAVERISDPIERLRTALQVHCAVSCSTIVKNDMYRPNGVSNLTGPLALILDPVYLKNITMCCHMDAGTRVDPNDSNARIGKCMDRITQESFPDLTLSDAILRRAGWEYNEICVRDYEVRGILITDVPARYPSVDARSEWDRLFDPRIPEERIITPTELQLEFPGITIYSWDPVKGLKRFIGVDSNDEYQFDGPITVATLYRK